MNGIIIVDKPKGFTSFDIVAKLRKKLSQRKIGHMGTLDPMATGVLPILLGDTAKFQIFANNNNKSYKAKIKFGITTDTLDITGQVLSTHRVDITKQDLKNVLYNMLNTERRRKEEISDYVLDKYNWDSVVEETEKLYK